jgi:hypothetical protein
MKLKIKNIKNKLIINLYIINMEINLKKEIILKDKKKKCYIKHFV